MNNLKLKIVFIISLLFIIFSQSVFADGEKISDIDYYVKEDGSVTLRGETDGVTDNMIILIKVFDKNKSLEYFNQITIKGNSFEVDFTPMDEELNTTLYVRIVGDLQYSGKFFYSHEFSDIANEIETKSYDLISSKYNVYYDDIIKTKLKFDTKVFYNGSALFVSLYGNNFTYKDDSWFEKDEYTWESYLSTITTKCYEITKNKPIYVYVYDSNYRLLEAFPNKASNAIIKVDDNFDESSIIIDDTALYKIIGDKFYYKDKITVKEEKFDAYYYFDFALASATETLVKINAISDFSFEDENWKYRDKVKFANYFKEIATLINKDYNVDIDIIVRDYDGLLLEEFNYYNFKEDDKTDTNKDVYEPEYGPNTVIDENYKPEKEVIIDSVYELDEDYQFIPWDEHKAKGLVLALKLYDYGYNSVEIPTKSNEKTIQGEYVHEVTVDYNEIAERISWLRKDSKRILYINRQIDTNNLHLNLSADIVWMLKNEDILLVFDTDAFKIEFDFSKLTIDGDLDILVSDDYSSRTDYSRAFMVRLRMNGQDARNYFEDGIKCLIHYDSEKTFEIDDLRSVNVFNSCGAMYNSTVEMSEKGFVFIYDGVDTYYLENNQYRFKDHSFEDKMAKDYAELVASKDIIKLEDKEYFNPRNGVTRGEFITFIANKLGAYSDEQHFANLEEGDEYYEAVNGVYELGILPSHYKKDLNLSTFVTREEMIYMVVRCYEVNESNDSNVKSAALLFRDKSEISTWAKAKVGIAAKLGLIEDDGLLYPTDHATREFAAVLFYKLLEIEGIF